MPIRKTKIVCTIGPASDSPEILREMIRQGMSVARLNFSHGSREEHGEKIRRIREVSNEMERPVAVLQDLAGPKIRIGTIPEPGVRLEVGQAFRLTVEEVMGTRERVSVTYPNLLKEVKPGDRILLASYGSGAGSDAFSFLVTEDIVTRRDLAPHTSDYIARRKPIDYAVYARYRRKLGLR